MKKNLLKILIAFLIALVLLPASQVMAADEEPTDVSLNDIEIFNSLIVADDFLAVVPYNLQFDSNPDPGIDDTYAFRLLDPTGTTELGSVLASPSYNDGYGQGVVSFYIASGMTANTSYIFRVQQNPSYYSSPEYWDFPVDNTNYSEESDQEAALKAKVIDIATSLTPEFGVQLLTTAESGSTVLSAYGEIYFLSAIPGLQTMCNTLFSVQLENPDFSKRTWSYTLATALSTKYAGTFIEDFMTGFAGLFSMETSPAMNALSVFLFVALMILAIWKFKATVLSSLLDGYCLLLDLMLMGFFSMIWAGFMAFVSFAIIGGGILLFKRS